MILRKNCPEDSRSLVLHKNEWNRLQKQAGPPEKPSQRENEYLKGLIEKSQGWMKHWPDSEHGVLAKAEKLKENQRAEQISTVKAFSKKKSHKNTAQEAIEKAKKVIFDESCYGNKLLSALRESKTLEERDVQVLFMKKTKKEEKELEEKESKLLKNCTFDLDKHTAAHGDIKKSVTARNAKENKEIYEKQKAEAIKAKQEEVLRDLENAKLIKYLLDKEQEAERKMKLLEKELLDKYAAEKKKVKDERALWEAEYQKEIEACHKQQVKLNCKIKKVIQNMNRGNKDPEIVKKVYEIVEKCQQEEKRRYNDFIEKRSKAIEDRPDLNEEVAKEKVKQDREKKVSTAEFNKKLAEYVRERECSNKCFCDRQCFIVNGERTQNIKKGKLKLEGEVKKCSTSGTKGAGEFCQRNNRLVSALKRRAQAPTPFSCHRDAHVHFAQAAEQVLKESKYKAPARKVVDEYRRNNGFDASSLPIFNY